MTLGQRLTQLRTQAGLSQDALAEQLGVSRQSVSKWETDGSIPDLNRLVKLSTVFGVTLDELVKGEAGQSPEPEADGSSASASESGQSAAAPAAELLRLHRQKLAGILLIAISLAVTLLNVALLFVTLPVFAAGVLCLLVRRRLGLPALYLLSASQLHPLTAGVLLSNFFPLLSADFYRSAPLGAVLWWCYVLAAVWLVRRTLRAARPAKS